MNRSGSAQRPASQQEPEATADVLAGLRLSSSPLARTMFALLGALCIVAALIGVVVPGWPTVPWLLVAAWLFSRSSPRFYRLLVTHPRFGPIVLDYRAGNGIPLRVKLVAITSVVLFAGLSAFLLISNGPLRLGVVAVAAFGIGFLTGLPTRSPYTRSAPVRGPGG